MGIPDDVKQLHEHYQMFMEYFGKDTPLMMLVFLVSKLVEAADLANARAPIGEDE